MVPVAPSTNTRRAGGEPPCGCVVVEARAFMARVSMLDREVAGLPGAAQVLAGRASCAAPAAPSPPRLAGHSDIQNLLY
jgi:hypothetical protein